MTVRVKSGATPKRERTTGAVGPIGTGAVAEVTKPPSVAPRAKTHIIRGQ